MENFFGLEIQRNKREKKAADVHLLILFSENRRIYCEKEITFDFELDVIFARGRMRRVVSRLWEESLDADVGCELSSRIVGAPAWSARALSSTVS